MKHAHLAVIMLMVSLTTACAIPQERTISPESEQKVEIAPPKEMKREKPAAEAELIGEPAPGSKFAKLKIGMTLKQVEALIGLPVRQWHHPTSKALIPFYFGPDRWVIQYVYQGEGVLTFNYGEEQLLTRIEVNKTE